MNHRRILHGLKFLALALVAMTAIGCVVMLLWNALVPQLFGGPSLSFWQAVGLLLLSHILLRGWAPWRYRDGWKHDRWRKRFEEKLATLSPEERDKLKAEWMHRCGSPFPGEPGKQPAGS